MKNYLLIVLVCIVLLFVSSYAKDDYKIIFVCDSLSNPICDAYIEIEQPVWGNTVFTGVTNNYGECKIKRDLPINKYGIIISHPKYNQYEGYLNLNENKKEYVMQIDSCYEFCVLEGKISCKDCKDSFLFDSRRYQSFFVRMFDGRHKIENFNYDTLGNYTLKLPPGEYTIIFHYWFSEIAKINITVIKDKNVKSNINFLYSDIYKTQPLYNYINYYNNFDYSKFNSIFDGLQYQPGVLRTE